MKREGLQSRRNFCRVLLGTSGLLIGSCRMYRGTKGTGPDASPVPQATPRPDAVFKYPKDADEIAVFFETFLGKDFDLKDAVARLGITGTAVITRKTEKLQAIRAAYPAQNDLVKTVQLDSSFGRLDEVHLIYSRPIPVDIDRLRHLILPPPPPLPPGTVGALSDHRLLGFQPLDTSKLPVAEPTPPTGWQLQSLVRRGPGDRPVAVSIAAEKDGIDTSPDIKNVWEIGFIR